MLLGNKHHVTEFHSQDSWLTDSNRRGVATTMITTKSRDQEFSIEKIRNSIHTRIATADMAATFNLCSCFDIILVDRFASDAVTSLEAGEDKSGTGEK